MISDEMAYKLLRMLDENPQMSQRAIANQLGISLGKVNYCLKGLMDKGILKARNFYKSENKTAYAYFITPKGIEEKAKITYRFLKRKMDEYEQLSEEIEELRAEAIRLKSNDAHDDNPQKAKL